MSAIQTAAVRAGLPPGSSRAATPTSFEELYAQTRDPLYAYVMGLLRDRDSAEEVTAQAFERALRSWKRIDRRRGDARTWLFGIARNAALDELRRQKRHAVPTEPADMAQLAGSAAEAAASDDRVLLQRALATLTTRDRELIALKYYAGLTNREISGVIRESESNVGTRLSRIIRQLRSTL